MNLACHMSTISDSPEHHGEGRRKAKRSSLAGNIVESLPPESKLGRCQLSCKLRKLLIHTEM